MKIKRFNEFKINETGEWNRNIDLQHTLDNPDSNDEYSLWIKDLYNSLNMIKMELNNSSDLDVIDIKGFDKYQGPYAIVKIKGKKYNIWTTEHNTLWIEDFIVDNTSELGMRPGFEGNVEEIVDVINKS